MQTILVSNDDGVDAPGITILAQKLWEVANVVVVAPNSDQSGASHSLTLSRPLRVSQLSNGFYSVNGTPSDCVHLAITGFLEHQPDMVISGINSGPNLGDDVLYSGTVAAAMEGRFMGYPSIAISSMSRDPTHYASAAKVAVDLVKQLQVYPLPPDTVLNVNVPDLPYDELRGWRITRLGQRQKAESVVRQRDPRGHEVYWIGLPGAENNAGEDTDFYAVNAGFVSITPLHADLTHHSALASLEQWLQSTL
ncbi:MAG: 5'/3'-nucleotidase SurE [Gammaproteobacteria bacterium]